MAFTKILSRKTDSFKDLSSLEPPREYPVRAEDYELEEECGRGVSATVWRARCKPHGGEIVAVKLIDLENVNTNLEEIQRETHLMRLQHHPNVLQLYCAFVSGQKLWIVMPYVSGGSVLNIMKYRYPEGLEEPVIATIMKEVLKALEYMHRHAHIHRDVKAGNILIDSNGQVYLADFGVAANMERGGSWGDQAVSRNTFVGTPCWMAPEVMEQLQGYNYLADIWSFGITLLELAHGHAPFAKYPPMKVLLMTIQNPPPQLEADSGSKHFSKAMRDIVAKCLVKDPTKRPTAAQLLEHKFFKGAHDQHFLTKTLLAGLPPVEKRVQEMRSGKAPTGATVLENRQALEQSQEAYLRGVSAWNFDVMALKAEAEKDDPELPTIEEGISSSVGPSRTESRCDSVFNGYDTFSKPPSLEVPSEVLSGSNSPSGIRPKGLPPRQPSTDKLVPPTPGKESSGKASSNGDAPKASTPESVRPPSLTGEGELSSSVTLKDGLAGAKSEADQRKGRFKIVEETIHDKGKPVPRNPSSQGLQPLQSGLPISIPTLLAPFLQLQEQVAVQSDVLKDFITGLQDYERGKHVSLGSLTSQLTERLLQRGPTREEYDKTKSELAAAHAENLRLKQQMKVLEEEVARMHRDG
eukprot:jgi/Botrbrau1/21884/Bobra.0249s0013.1